MVADRAGHPGSICLLF